MEDMNHFNNIKEILNYLIRIFIIRDLFIRYHLHCNYIDLNIILKLLNYFINKNCYYSNEQKCLHYYCIFII